MGDLGIAFVAGLLSCASACVLPLVPVFVAYLGGVSLGRSEGRGRWAPVAAACLFVAGFSTAFTAMGAGAGLLGTRLAVYRSWLVPASGAALIALGLALVASVPWLKRELRLHVAHKLPRTPAAAYIVGLTFAIGWTPCVGPILAAILIEAAGTTTVARGAALLAAYSAGMGVPFIATGLFVSPVTSVLSRVRGAAPIVNAVAAALLIAMGALTLTNHLTAVNGFAPSIPALAAGHLQVNEPAPEAPSARGTVGRPAPSVSVTAVDGRHLALGGFLGRPVVLTFWATWCEPCREELPLFDSVAQAHRGQDLQVVPVDYQEAAPAVRSFWNGLHLQLTPYLDPDGAVARRFGVGLQTTGLPVTVLVDRHGNVRSVIPGQVDPTFLDVRLNEILRG